MSKSRFAQKLEDLRKARGLSLVEAAKQAGISRHTWVAIEYDRSGIPKVAVLLRLSRFFDITIDALIKDTQHAEF
jgi:transcriptional regulator with XRE-family HTH domain